MHLKSGLKRPYRVSLDMDPNLARHGEQKGSMSARISFWPDMGSWSTMD